jgi:hypothetical protein
MNINEPQTLAALRARYPSQFSGFGLSQEMQK